jgi:hypothetical protein
VVYGANFSALFRRAAIYVDISKHVGRVKSQSVVCEGFVLSGGRTSIGAA